MTRPGCPRERCRQRDRDPGDGRLRLLDGVELQPRPAPRGRLRRETAPPARFCVARPSTTSPDSRSTRARSEHAVNLDAMNTPKIRVGVIGAGNVGSAFVELLSDESRHVALVDAAMATLEVVGVAVRDPKKLRPGIAPNLLSSDALALANREDIDVLVELSGGVDPARTYVEAALSRGVSVVTANKALMAECGTELAELANENGADLFYEAAVGGGIPILRSLRTSLAGERIERVMGIVNGTTNFILSKMTSEGSDYAVALAEAQALGYAEADPSADVDAFDAAAKVQILSSLAFGTELRGEQIAREGITGVRAIDVDFARRNGYVIKLVGVAERVGETDSHDARIPR